MKKMKLVEFDAVSYGKIWVNPLDIVSIKPAGDEQQGGADVALKRSFLGATTGSHLYFSVKASPADVVDAINRALNAT
jgi:hypothetical protein